MEAGMNGEIEDDGWITLWPPFGSIDRALRAIYDPVLAEPVPEHLQSLLERLSEQDREQP
jgi:hypothetical protein